MPYVGFNFSRSPIMTQKKKTEREAVNICNYGPPASWFVRALEKEVCKWTRVIYLVLNGSHSVWWTSVPCRADFFARVNGPTKFWCQVNLDPRRSLLYLPVSWYSAFGVSKEHKTVVNIRLFCSVRNSDEQTFQLLANTKRHIPNQT